MLFQSVPEQAIPVCVVPEEELQVYKAALSHLLGNELHVLVLEDRTQASRTLQSGETEIYRHFYPVWAAYLKANEGNCKVAFSLKVSDSQVLLTHEAIEAYFVGEENYSWKRFRAEFSERSAYARVSRVGFGDKGQKALLYIEYMRGHLAGAGAYLLVVKSQDRWRVARVWVTWES